MTKFRIETNDRTYVFQDAKFVEVNDVIEYMVHNRMIPCNHQYKPGTVYVNVNNIDTIELINEETNETTNV